MRTLFFLINFTGSALYAAICIPAVLYGPTPVTVVGGIVFFPPAVALAVAEWIAWHRRNRDAEKVVTAVPLGLAALAVFGVVTNVGEALQKGQRDGLELFLFAVVGCLIAAYLGSCGVWRLRAIRRPQPE